MMWRIFVSCVLVFGLTAGPVSAVDICTTASRALTMTVEQIDAFNVDHIRGNIFTGRGKIYHVEYNAVDADEAYTISVDCGNNVTVILYADDMFGRRHHLEKGETISFYGEASEMRQPQAGRIQVFINVLQ